MWRNIAFVLTLSMLAFGCTVNDAVREDALVAESNLNRLNDAQPVPEFSWSQLRQNLIEINQAQADTTQTTSFFFNMGVVDPILVCPSIGFPIPSTAQLTNPLQAARITSGGDRVVLPQAEQTGIYTGDSTGTYAICVDGLGRPYAQYWEGFIATASGPAEWDRERKEMVLVGAPSFEFSSGER